MPYSLLMDLTEKQVKFFTDSGKTLRRFFSPKKKAYFRSFNLNHSISVFLWFFFVAVVSVEIKTQMVATVTKKDTQYSAYLSTIDKPQIFSLIPY